MLIGEIKSSRSRSIMIGPMSRFNHFREPNAGLVVSTWSLRSLQPHSVTMVSFWKKSQLQLILNQEGETSLWLQVWRCEGKGSFLQQELSVTLQHSFFAEASRESASKRSVLTRPPADLQTFRESSLGADFTDFISSNFSQYWRDDVDSQLKKKKKTLLWTVIKTLLKSCYSEGYTAHQKHRI